MSFKKLLKKVAPVLAFSCVLAVPGFSQSAATPSGQASGADSGKLSAADQKFVKEAAQGGLAEVELGQLAQEKASNPDVKAFGQRMVEDHSKANDQLKQVASQKGVTLPTTMSAKDKAEKARLSKLSGADFDKAYMKGMMADHHKDIADFQKAASTASDPDVKNFAQSTLPTLQSHLQQAESIAPQHASNQTSTTASNQPQQ